MSIRWTEPGVEFPMSHAVGLDGWSLCGLEPLVGASSGRTRRRCKRCEQLVTKQDASTTSTRPHQAVTVTLGVMGAGGFLTSYLREVGTNVTTGLAEAIARDVAAITADFDGKGGQELPRPPADLTTYADAYESARKNCPHENVRETMYAYREGFCEDCRRFVHYKPGMFGGGWS